MSDGLLFYVIYNDPKDYPGESVVRKQWAEAGQVRIDPKLYLQGRDVQTVRSVLLDMHPGLVRSPVIETDPAIVEVWM